MKKRVRLLEFSQLIQATLLKYVNNKDNDSIKVTVYGYTKEYNHIEFSYDIEFPTESDRDLTFDEITTELMFQDVKIVIANSKIPILI